MSIIDDLAKKRMAGVPKPTAPATKPTPQPAAKSSVIDKIAEQRKVAAPVAAPAPKPRASTDVSREKMRDLLMTPVPEKVIDLGNGVKEIHLPTGEVWRQDAAGNPVETSRTISSKTKKELRGGKSFEESQLEVDHLIPKALGGTDDDTNLRAAQSKKTLSQAAYDFVTGDKRLPGDYLPKNRQEGKMVVEWEAINQYKAGKITINQARAAVSHYDNTDFVGSVLGPEFAKTMPTEKGKPVSLSSVIMPEGPSLLDMGKSAFFKTADWLSETGVFNKLAEEVEERPNVAKGFDVVSNFARGLKPTKENIPIAGTVLTAKDMVRVLDVGKKMNAGAQVSDEDRKFFTDYFDARDKAAAEGAAYKTGRAITNSVSFMLELAGAAVLAPETGGASAFAVIGAKAATKKGLVELGELLAKREFQAILARDVGSWAANAGVRVGLQATAHVPQGTVERMIGSPIVNQQGDFTGLANDGQSLSDAVRNSAVDSLIESGSEFMGAGFGTVGKVGQEVLLKSAALKFLTRENPALTPNVVSAFLSKVGWNGFLSELGEERLGEALRIVAQESGVTTDYQYRLPTQQDILVELASFAILGTVANSMERIATTPKKVLEQQEAEREAEIDAQSEQIKTAITAQLDAGASPAAVVMELSKNVGVDAANVLVTEAVAEAVKPTAAASTPAAQNASTPAAAPLEQPVAQEGQKPRPAAPAVSQANVGGSSIAAKTAEKLMEMGAKVLKQTPADLHNEFMRSQDSLEGGISGIRERVTALEERIDAAQDGSPEQQSAQVELDALMDQVEESEAGGTEEFQVYGSHVRSRIRERVSAAYPSATDEQLDAVIDDTLDVITDGEAAAAMYNRPIEEIADLMATRTLGDTEKEQSDEASKATREQARAERRKAGAVKAEENRKAATEKKVASKAKPSDKKPVKKTDAEKRDERKEKVREIKKKRGELKNEMVVREAGGKRLPVPTEKSVFLGGPERLEATLEVEGEMKRVVTNIHLLEVTDSVPADEKVTKAAQIAEFSRVITSGLSGAEDQLGAPTHHTPTREGEAVQFVNGKTVITISAKYYNYFAGKYDAEFFGSDNRNPVVVKQDGKLVGMVMPIAVDILGKPLTTKREGAVARAASVSKEKLSDVGEKIGGANKDRIAKIGEKYGRKLTIEEIIKLSTVESLPHIDYSQLTELGIGKETIYVLAMARASTGMKPRSRYELRRWAENVQAIRGMYADVLGKNVSNDRAFQAANNFFGAESVKATFELYDKLDFFNNDKAQEYYLRSGQVGNRTTLFRDRKYVRDFVIVDGKVMGGQDAIEAIAEYVSGIPTETKERKERSMADNIGLFRKRTGEVVAAFKKGSVFHEFEVFANLEAGRAAVKDPKNIEKWVKELEVMTDFDKNSFRGTTTGVIKRDYRNGRDITAQEFMDTFGMRGVEFGNWVTGDERQERINAAFDSFKDLARILDIPDAAIGLNGELGFAFGSRGRKGAIAHYEAEKIVINITRHDGAGTLAHEWWHAFDNYLARRDEKTRSFVTGSGYSRADLDQKIKALMTYIRGSDLYKRSGRADSFKSKRYFVEPTELGARAFEVFVKESLTDLGLTNNFLVNVINSKDLKPGLNDMYPYATGEEIEPVKNLMNEIFEEVRVDETTDKKAMFKLDVRQTEAGIQSAAEATGVLEDYKERLGIDFDVKFVDTILVGSDPSGFAKMRGVAQGATLDNTVVLLKEMSATTAEHETVHLTMANLDQIEAFKSEGITREKLLVAKAAEMGVSIEGNERAIEEEIAHGFEEYIAGKEKTGILRKFFAVLKKLLVRFVSAFAKSNGNIVRDYYDILSEGRSAAGVEVVLGNRGLVEHFIENGTIHLSLEAAEFKFDKEADPRWRQVEEQFNEASEKLDALKADLIVWRGDINRLLEQKATSKEAAGKVSETARELSKFTVKKTGKLTERGIEEAKKLGIDLAAVEPEIAEYLKRRAEIQEASVALSKLRDKIADGRKRKFGDAMMLRQVKRKLRFREALLGSRPFRSGFVAGKAEGEKGMKLDLLAQMRRRDADVEDIRRQVREMVVEQLPQERRGRFVPMVSKAKTLRDLVDAYFRVTAAVTRMKVEENAEIIRATLKRVKDAVANGKGIAVEYQKRILDILDGVDIKRPTSETISRLQRLAQYVSEHGETHGVPQEYLDQLKRLSRKPLAEMSLEDLEALAVRLETLEEQGRLKLKLLTARTEREQAIARAALTSSTRNLDVIAPDNTDPTKWQSLKSDAKNAALRLYHFFRVADILDGRQDYRGENVRLQRTLAHAETRAKTRNVETTQDVMEKLSEIKDDWTKEENDAITFHLLIEQGAEDAANNLANARGWKTAPAKTSEMTRAMDLMRASFETRRNELTEVYEAETNKPFKPVARYFPIKYEKASALKEEPSIDELLNIAGVPRTKTAQGFTISRVKNVERVPRTDWLAVFEEATREQTWFIEVQPAIINAKALVFHPEYQAAAGEMAVELWRDWLSNMAKRGRTDFDVISKMMARGRMSINRAVLGYRLSSIAIQPFAIVEAMAYIQAMRLNKTSGKMAALRVLGGFARSWTSPAFFRSVMAQSEMLRLRAGGEQAIEEQLESFESEDSWFAKFQRGGLKLLSAADVRTAAGVQRGLYDTFIADGMAEKDARLHADFIMNVVSGSSEIADRPLALSGKTGEFMKTLLTFQSFALNVWGIMWHDLIRSRLITRGNVSDKANAIIGLGILTLSQMGQQVLRDTIKAILNPDDDDEEEKKDEKLAFLSGFWGEAALLVPNQIPILGSIIKTVERTGSADFSIPLAKPFVDFVSGTNDLAKAGVTTGPKAAAYRERGIVNMMAGAAAIFGIAGTSQATDLLKNTFEVGGATPNDREVRTKLLEKAAKKDKLDAEEIAKQVADPEKWDATDEAGEKYRNRLVAQIEQEYVLVTKYPKSQVADAVMGHAQLKDRIDALMELADTVGIDKVAEEIVAMRTDAELQGPKGSGVSDFISSNLYKAFREAEAAYKAASASK